MNDLHTWVDSVDALTQTPDGDVGYNNKVTNSTYHFFRIHVAVNSGLL
jgi:hypothetical protein